MNFKKLYNKFFYKPDLENASKEFTPEILKAYNQSRPMGAQEKLCYAPFKNIYFGHYGKATACCYNRNFVLGTYPANSIEEIWFGEEADKLRKSISANNLDFGCKLCKHHILAQNFDANKAHQYDQFTLNKNKFPSVLEFELSNTCNLECTMCSGDFSSLIRQNREKLPPLPQVYDKAFVEQLEPFIPYLEEAKFYGGEPFLIEIYFDIWEKIIEINPKVRISVQTNGTILNKRVKDLLKKANFHINMSIDSLEEESYQKIRINAKFDRVKKNIDWFQAYCKEKDTFFGISACLMNNNYKELPKFVDYCNKLNCPVYFHFVDYPEQLALKSLSNEALTEIHEYLSSFSFSAENAVQIKNKTHYFDTIKHIKYLTTQKATVQINHDDQSSFLKAIQNYIGNLPYLETEEKEQKYKQIEMKLLKVFGQIEDKKLLAENLKNLNFNDMLIAKRALEFIESSTEEELLQMAKNG